MGELPRSLGRLTRQVGAAREAEAAAGRRALDIILEHAVADGARHASGLKRVPALARRLHIRLGSDSIRRLRG